MCRHFIRELALDWDNRHSLDVSWYVYVVRCRDGSLYTGISRDVASRVDAHNRGLGARYTRSRRPVELLYEEQKTNQGAALRRELAIKALPRKAKLELLARGSET